MKIVLSEKEFMMVDIPEEVKLDSLTGIVERLQRIQRFMAKDPLQSLDNGSRKRNARGVYDTVVQDKTSSYNIIKAYYTIGVDGVIGLLKEAGVANNSTDPKSVYYLVNKCKTTWKFKPADFKLKAWRKFRSS